MPNTKALCLVVSDKIFSMFYLYKSIQTCDPGAGPFWPQGHNLNKLDRGPLGDASYQISRLKASWFQTRRFFSYFPI